MSLAVGKQSLPEFLFIACVFLIAFTSNKFIIAISAFKRYYVSTFSGVQIFFNTHSLLYRGDYKYIRVLDYSLFFQIFNSMLNIFGIGAMRYTVYIFEFWFLLKCSLYEM